VIRAHVPWGPRDVIRTFDDVYCDLTRNTE
jgi:hypothetical protein